MSTQRLWRSMTDRVLGGVCGGLAAVIGISAWWLRAAFAILGVFTAGTGALIYLALWLLIPAQRLATVPLGRSQGYARSSQLEAIVLIGVAVIAMGLIVLVRNLDVLSIGSADMFWPVVVIAFGLIFLVKQLRRAA